MANRGILQGKTERRAADMWKKGPLSEGTMKNRNICK